MTRLRQGQGRFRCLITVSNPPCGVPVHDTVDYVRRDMWSPSIDSADPFAHVSFLSPVPILHFLPWLFSFALTQFNLITAAASVRETATVLWSGCECDAGKY